MRFASQQATSIANRVELEPGPDEITTQLATGGALLCIRSSASLIDIAHLALDALKKIDPNFVRGFMTALSAHSAIQTVLLSIEPDLLRTRIGPAAFAGIKRQTAHAAAFAVAEKVYQAVCKASGTSLDPHHDITPEDKLRWDSAAVRRALHKINPFDAALFTEMVKQEADEMAQIQTTRREAEKRAKDLATIDERHRTALTLMEVAEKCGVCVRTVSRWIESGKLRCAEQEGKNFFDIREIEVRSDLGKKKGRKSDP